MPRKIVEMREASIEEMSTPRRRPSPLIGIVVIALLLAAGAWLGAKFVTMPEEDSPYSAVYLTTGDVYFGKYERFPRPHLEDPMVLSRNGEQVGIVPFKDVFWGPGKDLYLNSEHVVFWSRIRAGSQIAEFLKNPGAASSPAPQPAESSTTTE